MTPTNTKSQAGLNRISLKTLIVIALALCSLSAIADDHSDEATAHRTKSLDIFRAVIEIPTVAGRGNGQKIVDYLSAQLIEAGFSDSDIQTVTVDGAVGMTVRFAGQAGTELRPILLLAHMDVVEAFDSDWERPPFTLTEDDDFYYGRGTKDNKYGVTMLTSTFIRLKKQGFRPNRDIYLVFTGDEETSMLTSMKLANDTAYLSNAEYALNSDGGGGDLDSNHQKTAFKVQSAEKTYATFELTIRNQGGHSSAPRSDNAVYELVSALDNLKNYTFPTKHTGVARAFFRFLSERYTGELAQAMKQFAENPDNPEAIAALSAKPQYNTLLRTTCVATMLSGGHAENALAQSATATINCRIFPGETVESVQQKLFEVFDNENAEFKLLYPYPASPTSEPRDDVMAAIRIAVDTISPESPLVPFMTPGMTDGALFRGAGIPTWGVSGAYIRAEDSFAHGLNERLPKKAFEEGLNYWTVLLKALTAAGASAEHTQ